MLTTTQLRTYKQYRAKGSGAADALRYARYKVGARLPWNHNQDRAEVPQHGMNVVVRIKPDHDADFTDWLGEFSDKWEHGAVKHTNRHSLYSRDVQWFKPAYSLAQRYEDARVSLRMGKDAAYLFARQGVERDYLRAADYGNGWSFIGVVVDVYKEGVKLGAASLWGIESDSDVEFIEETAIELISEAIEEARTTLTRLCATN